jgi:hypothetical protein
MRHELSRTSEQCSARSNGHERHAGKRESEAIRQDFARISPLLAHIAHDRPPRLSREKWSRFQEQLKQNIAREGRRRSMRLWWRTMRDGLRASDSTLWRAARLAIIAGAIMALLIAVYVVASLLWPPAHTQGLAPAALLAMPALRRPLKTPH